MGGQIAKDTSRVVSYLKPEHMKTINRFGKGKGSAVIALALEFLAREMTAAGITSKDLDTVRQELGL
jgi:hypothetical protein